MVVVFEAWRLEVTRRHTGAIATLLASYRKRRINLICDNLAAWSVGIDILGKAQGAQSPPQGANYHEDSFFARVMGNLNRSKGTNGTLVSATPTHFLTNILSTPADSNCVMLEERRQR